MLFPFFHLEQNTPKPFSLASQASPTGRDISYFASIGRDVNSCFNLEKHFLALMTSSILYLSSAVDLEVEYGQIYVERNFQNN